MRYIERLKKKIPNAQEIDQLMGIGEGNIRKNTTKHGVLL